MFKYNVDGPEVQEEGAEEVELVFEGPHNSIGARIDDLRPEGCYQFAAESFNAVGMCVRGVRAVRHHHVARALCSAGRQVCVCIWCENGEWADSVTAAG